MKGGGRASRAVAHGLATAAAIAVAVAATSVSAKPKGDDVHRSDTACTTCHGAEAAALRRDTKAAAANLAPDLESRCTKCHDEGPSHRTGVRPVRPEPPALPLAADGTIGCATCHFMHGENDQFGDFLRMDNRKGGLCLSCHELSELQ
jgi:predicted CXXCH cytochrome family protein